MSTRLSAGKILTPLLSITLVAVGLGFLWLGRLAYADSNERLEVLILGIVVFLFMFIGAIFSWRTPPSRFLSVTQASYLYTLMLLGSFVFVCNFGLIDAGIESPSCEYPGMWLSALFAFLITACIHWWLRPTTTPLGFLWLFLSSGTLTLIVSFIMKYIWQI